VGGEDDQVLDPAGRDGQIAGKTERLVRGFSAIFPGVQIEPAFAWAGVFGSTKDGLAYIGSHRSFPRAFFALGFGGNGMTFGEIASRILADAFLGRRNRDEKTFGSIDGAVTFVRFERGPLRAQTGYRAALMRCIQEQERRYI
jgi:glycine/D-amino acid oxidase-like deaminating enzyme